jgi:hypothetical protein
MGALMERGNRRAILVRTLAAAFHQKTRSCSPELLLIREEPRKVMRDECISYYGPTYRVPDRYISRWVWTILKGETLGN